jgi:IS5 family transposase
MTNASHSLVKLSQVVDWDKLDATIGKTFCPTKWRPAISKRLMVALHYFKYTFDLSDEKQVVLSQQDDTAPPVLTSLV